MKKILTIVLVLTLTAALASAALASVEPSVPAAAADSGTVRQVWKEATASEPGMEVEIDAQTGEILAVYYIPATGGSSDFADWQLYVEAYALAGAPNEEEGQAVAALIEAATTPEEVEAIAQLGILFENVGMLPYAEWIAAGMPDADVAGMTSEAANQAASGEASQEPAGEASGEPSEEPAAPGAASEEPVPVASEAPETETSEEPAAEDVSEEEAPANPNYDPNAQPWATIEIVFVIIILVVGAILMLSFGKKKS